MAFWQPQAAPRITILSDCGEGRGPTTMNQTEKGKIEIQCPPLFISKFRAYSIYLDEMKVGRIKEGKTATISTTPGIHTIWLRIDWVRSNRKQVSIEANKTVRLIIERNQMEGWEYWGMLIVVGLLIAV